MVAAVDSTQAVLITGQTQAVSPIGVSRAELERQRRTRGLIALLVFLLLALAVIAFFVLRALGVFAGSVSVPNVDGQTAQVADQMLRSDGLTVGTSTSRTSSSVLKGLVITTNPSAGTK